METPLLLLSYPCSILPQPQSQSSCPFPNPNLHLSQNPNVSSHLRRLCTRYRRWDSNAETQRFNFNFRDNVDEGDGDEDSGPAVGGWGEKRRWWSDDSSETDERSGILEEVIDSVWIFKVFRSFGWMFPAIIISLLLVTGPKAFLMALALPIGQSALSLAFEKLWGRTQNGPKRKARAQKKSSASTASNFEMEEEQEDSRGTRHRKMGYQSWVVGNDGSVDNGGQDAPSFGGWDELDRRRKFDMGGSARTRSGSPRTPVEKGKLSRRKRKRDTPLLLRLLIAIFPFLDSWTKML